MRVFILTAARWRSKKTILMVKISFDHSPFLLSLDYFTKLNYLQNIYHAKTFYTSITILPRATL